MEHRSIPLSPCATNAATQNAVTLANYVLAVNATMLKVGSVGSATQSARKTVGRNLILRKY